ncbi:hypothetical protein [Stutzerimonas nitrititolerans]|uniref:hypothetical protein n=1 Tax=Stutzerimonas nitrititolerans TaxID=2482751 RepID=UPI0028ACDE7D|nr:hypothetical protein [Stutzerimonas nitrititolerans]
MTTSPLVKSLIEEQLEEVITRFQACNVGNMWHIHDRVTGKTAGFCVSHRAALVRAQQLEVMHGR